MKWRKRKPSAREPIESPAEPVESPAEAEARFRRENPVEQVCASLRDGDFSARWDAATKLARLRDPEAMQPLLDALDKERIGRDGSAAYVIVEALAAIGGREAEHRLGSLLRDMQYWHTLYNGDMDIVPARDWVTSALVELGGPDLLLRCLFDALTDERPTIRGNAAGELADIAYRSTVGYRVTVSGEGTLTDVHRESMYGPLHSALADTSARVRERAVVALGLLGNTNALESMIARLDDKNGRVRYFAAEALGELGDVRAVEPLRRFVNDDHSAVAVKKALVKLTRR